MQHAGVVAQKLLACLAVGIFPGHRAAAAAAGGRIEGRGGRHVLQHCCRGIWDGGEQRRGQRHEVCELIGAAQHVAGRGSGRGEEGGRGHEVAEGG
jgi:hypothetical protein